MAAEHVPYENVTLESIDSAVVAWFDSTVDAHVEDPSGERRKVQVRMASGERWITSREKKGMRDRDGKLVLPIISVRRTGISSDPSMQSLGVETHALTIARRISPKTNTLRNNDKVRTPSQRLADPPVVYEISTIPFPDRRVMSYEFQVQTQYVSQMNAILEKLFYTLDIQYSFVAPLEFPRKQNQSQEPFETRKPISQSYVVGFFDQDLGNGDNFEEFTDQERIVRYTTTFRVPVVLQLDPEGTRPAIQVERTSFVLRFGDEQETVLDDPYEVELLFEQGIIPKKNSSVSEPPLPLSIRELVSPAKLLRSSKPPRVPSRLDRG